MHCGTLKKPRLASLISTCSTAHLSAYPSAYGTRQQAYALLKVDYFMQPHCFTCIDSCTHTAKTNGYPAACIIKLPTQHMYKTSCCCMVLQQVVLRSMSNGVMYLLCGGTSTPPFPSYAYALKSNAHRRPSKVTSTIAVITVLRLVRMSAPVNLHLCIACTIALSYEATNVATITHRGDCKRLLSHSVIL